MENGNMKRTITIIAIAIILITFAIAELILVGNIVDYMEDSINNIAVKYSENKDDISVLSEEIKTIDDYWDKYESTLCLIFSHKDLSVTTDSLNKLMAYTKNNDYDNAIAEIELLKSMVEKNHHIMGFNIHNVL